jgi:Protein of unknown function (DUF3808)
VTIGAEYTLCIALSLLMSAVVSFLSESVVESLKGAYKLRKAYQLLHKMFDMIVDVDGKAPVDSNRTATPTTYPVDGVTHASPERTPEDSDEDDFVDATDNPEDFDNPMSLPESLEILTLSEETIDTQVTDLFSGRPSSSSGTPTTATSRTINRQASITTISTFYEIPTPPESGTTFTDQIIYSGTLMALGSIMLLISILPPSLSRLLSIIGFRGSRSQALSMLWKVSAQNGPFGALGTFVLGAYYGNIVQNSDIVPDEYSSRDGNGVTLKKLHTIIIDVRRRYPLSVLWAVEEVSFRRRKD